jgi:hypothetical protein
MKLKLSYIEGNIYYKYEDFEGARGGVVVNTLRYKPAGRGFVSRWFHRNFSVT